MNHPIHVDEVPPRSSRVMYKVVALVHGMPTSIFDGVTTYPIGQTVYQQVEEDHGGGIYCYRSIEECLARDEATFPRQCALLNAPRSIVRMLAWNLSDAPVPITYGAKKAYSLVCATTLIPMPLSWTALRGAGYSAFANAEPPPSPYHTETTTLGGKAYVVGASEAARPAPRHVPSPGVLSRHNNSRRIPQATSFRIVQTQARTLELEMEVTAMEERLRAARGLLPVQVA